MTTATSGACIGACITYLIEIKEKNSSNIFLIAVNENLYFKI